MNKLILSFLLLVSTTEVFAEAGYYRIWQGSRRADLTAGQFQAKLPEFMNWTLSLYGDVLNQYLVAVPPTLPDIPDEFALVALSDEKSYREIKATDEGQRYTEGHWGLFAKDKSGSVPQPKVIPDDLENNQGYDLSGGPVDWTEGYIMFFLGTRKSEIPAFQFMRELSDHIQAAAVLLKPALQGYVVLANENYEAAYLKFSSKAEMEKAFATIDGQIIAKDGARLMNLVMWTNATNFDGSSVIPGSFYSTK